MAKSSKEKQKQGHDEQKKVKMKNVQKKKTTNDKEEHTPLNQRIVTQKQDVRKLIPRKSAMARNINTNLETLMTSTFVHNATSTKK